MNEPLLHMLVGLFMSATVLAIQLAAPMLIATLVVDLVLGLVGKTMPQMNVMSAGVSLRTVVGIIGDRPGTGFDRAGDSRRRARFDGQGLGRMDRRSCAGVQSPR